MKGSSNWDSVSFLTDHSIKERKQNSVYKWSIDICPCLYLDIGYIVAINVICEKVPHPSNKQSSIINTSEKTNRKIGA
jgi:hypothetical protein